MSIAYAVCLIVLIAIVAVVDRYYPILRDIPVDAGAAHTKRPYSLGRIQMAFWTIIVIGSIVYVYFVVSGGTAVAIDPKLAILIGISGTTGVLAAAVDNDKDKKVEAARAALTGIDEALAALDAQIEAAQQERTANAAGAPGQQTMAKLTIDRAAKTTEKDEQERIIKRLQRGNGSKGIISDMLTDENGNSLHRLQLVLFTLLYGAMFVWSVGSTGSLDKMSFNDQMLEFMGVAGGVYVGFKVPGKTVA